MAFDGPVSESDYAKHINEQVAAYWHDKPWSNDIRATFLYMGEMTKETLGLKPKGSTVFKPLLLVTEEDIYEQEREA